MDATKGHGTAPESPVISSSPQGGRPPACRHGMPAPVWRVLHRAVDPYTKDADSSALVAAKEMLEKRGSSPRLCKNTLVFLAVDKARLADLDEAVRRYLAWQSIVNEAKTLDLTPHQEKQAETQRDNADNAVKARLPESYQWLLSPQHVNVPDDGLFGMIVKPDVAVSQILDSTPTAQPPAGSAGGNTGTPTPGTPQPGGATPPPSGGQPAKPKRFYATVKIDASRMDRDVGQISREVVQHLVGQLMSDVEVTIEIQATVPDGFPEKTVRTVSENCRTLKFTQHDFVNE